MSELIEELLRQGRLLTAETTYGKGIRTAAAKESERHRQPVEQISGQLTMALGGEEQSIGASNKRKKVKSADKSR